MGRVRTVLERMLLFKCDICNECFPTFHPAYDPTDQVDLQLMRRNSKKVAHCNTEVATWQDLPPLRASGEELLVASKHSGRCWACHVDIERQVELQNGSTEGIVPKRSFLNGMYTLYNFPCDDVGKQLRDGKQLREFFSSATVLEAMLVALEHMQVSFVRARRTGLPKFVKNVISFPQDIGSFAKRFALLAEYRVKDRVNSMRVPPEKRDEAGATLRQRICVDLRLTKMGT